MLPVVLQVTRLHALAIRKLPPLTTTSSSSSTAAAADLQQQQQPAALPRSLPGHLAGHLPLLRQRALALLAAPLAGDMLAAEYLLLAALGSVSAQQCCFLLLVYLKHKLQLLQHLEQGMLCTRHTYMTGVGGCLLMAMDSQFVAYACCHSIC